MARALHSSSRAETDVRRRAASDLSLRTAPASTVSVSFVFITRILIGEHVCVKRGRRTAAAGSWSRVKSHDGEDSVEQRIAAVQGTGDRRQTGLKTWTMERGAGSEGVWSQRAESIEVNQQPVLRVSASGGEAGDRSP